MTPSSPTTPGGSHYAQAEKPHLFALGQDLHEQPITIEWVRSTNSIGFPACMSLMHLRATDLDPLFSPSPRSSVLKHVARSRVCTLSVSQSDHEEMFNLTLRWAKS